MSLEVTEDADVGELLAVAVGGQGEQEGPLEAHEAPHTGQVETPGVRQGCGKQRETHHVHESAANTDLTRYLNRTAGIRSHLASTEVEQ